MRVFAGPDETMTKGLNARWRQPFAAQRCYRHASVEIREKIGPPPRIAHVVHALHIGGLENGLVNLINETPPERYRHAVICLTDYDDFANRIKRKDVPIITLSKRQGQDWGMYFRLWRCFRQLQPDIVHTRNLATLEAQLPAFTAGVPGRVHSEHGRDIPDLDGTNWKYTWLRRVHRPFIHRFVALSRDLERYLRTRIGIPAARITRIGNGVDTTRFTPRSGDREVLKESGVPKDAIVIGTVGRMEPVKDPLNLVRAFLLLLERWPNLRNRLRLVMVGGGTLYEEVSCRLAASEARELAWLPGSRDDTPEIYRTLDIFVLPSLAEGISNTILEAMACGLPIAATRVGGNPELVEESKTGFLVPSADPKGLADAITRYIESPELRAAHGQAARLRAVQKFSMEQMIQQYMGIYDSLIRKRSYVFV